MSSAGVDEKEPLQFDDNLSPGNVAACRDLIESIEEDRLPEANILEARTTVEMIAAVFESHRVSGPVPLPLAERRNPLTLF